MTVMMNHTGLRPPETLIFVEADEDWSVYRTRSGEEVYLQHGTARVLVAFDDLDIDALYQEFRAARYSYLDYSDWSVQQEFLEELRGLTHEPWNVDEVIRFCPDCNRPDDEDNFNYTNEGTGIVCDTCYEYYTACAGCEDRYRRSDMTHTLHDERVCNSCRDSAYSWCEDCDGWHHDEYSGDHEHGGCGCEAPAQQFTIRNDGDEPLANDTRVTITLPAGVISDVGLGEIASEIRNHASTVGTHTDEGDKLWRLSYGLQPLGDLWQTREGNYTKRLSRLAYKSYGLKVTPDLMSMVGTIARNHSMAVDFEIEVTRDLNMSASDFYHDESCWWQSYSESRCALKSNGGFGLRTFHPDGWVSGRAWVMPLRLTDDGPLTPTFETMTPDAFVVFNGYGNLEGYAPARLLAHMAGMTYRKITFTCTPMYVNSSVGYLLAPEEIAEPYTDGRLSLSVSQHARLFDNEKELAHA